MKDDTRRGLKDKPIQNQPQYRITSDLQEGVDARKIFDRMLEKNVEIPIKELIGISPTLQKILSEATRPRHEYTARKAEYSSSDISDEVSDKDEAPADVVYAESSIDDTGYRGVKLIMENHSLDWVTDFVQRNANVVPLPSSPFLAMVTGAFTVAINGVTFRVMIDTGSELNVCNCSVPARCALALDHQGSHWSLKGIYGNPERLNGLCTDVGLKIGGHIFPTALFVSNNRRIGIFDIILGQPFLHWFAASIEYDRSGEVNLVLCKEGDQQITPTLSIVIVKPGDPRNQTEIQLAHTHQSAYVEDYESEEEEERQVEDF
ncbi:hypothetical protein BDZ89DRAFT_1132890 [Hymenopellis radicata]|nr:hypothetical protein BDZ89DRAFT_1132890 [Hymenopellis radicata]